MLGVPEGGLVDPRQAVVVQRQRPQGGHALERPGLDPADVVVVQLELGELIERFIPLMEQPVLCILIYILNRYAGKGCVNLPQRPQGARRRDSRNLAFIFSRISVR